MVNEAKIDSQPTVDFIPTEGKKGEVTALVTHQERIDLGRPEGIPARLNFLRRGDYLVEGIALTGSVIAMIDGYFRGRDYYIPTAPEELKIFAVSTAELIVGTAITFGACLSLLRRRAPLNLIQRRWEERNRRELNP